MRTDLSVAGVGMSTSIGTTARETLAALLAGRRNATALSLVDLRGDRVVGCFALPVSPELCGLQRALALVRPALEECLSEAGGSSGPTALFLCTPVTWGGFAEAFVPVLGPLPEPWPALVDVLVDDLRGCGIGVPVGMRVLLPHGHAAGALALRRACELFERGEAAQALIVGVDAHGDRATLERLDLLGVLRSRRSPGGFVPGEAAVVLCIRPALDPPAGPGLVQGLGLAHEAEVPSAARALTGAIRDAMTEWSGTPAAVGMVAIDLNGERARAREWTFAAMRTLHREGAVPVLIHPADRLGDVGAATLPLLLGVLSRCPRDDSAALVVASSMHGLRGAVMVGGRT